MTAKARYKIGLLGFGESDRTMLELYFTGQHQSGFQLGKPERADALLIDFSTEAGNRQYQKLLKQFPTCADLPGLAVTEKDTAPQGFLLLKRPLTMRLLSEQLDALLDTMPEADADFVSPSEQVRNSVFAEWQARKEAGATAMEKWNQSKQLSNSQRNPFPIDRHDLQEVVSKAHLVLAHRQNNTAKPVKPAKSVTGVDAASNVDTSVSASAPLEDLPRYQSVCIDEAFNQVSVADYCGYLPDQDLTDQGGLRRICFNIENSLLPWLVKAVHLGRKSHDAQQVSGLPGTLIYLPTPDSFFCDLDADLLLHMARARFGVGELYLQQSEPSAAVMQAAHRFIAADQLIWKLALLTSRGRIPDTIDLYKPIQLIRKPDFSMFELTPHARTLAEIWYQKRLSPVQMLSESAVPQRYVFTFLVAADAVGYFKP